LYDADQTGLGVGESILRAGVLYYDINLSGGRELVAISMIKCLKQLGFKITLICGKRSNRARIAEYFGTDVQLDSEVVIPFWKHTVRTYFEFVLSRVAKSFCDILIDPFTSEILPWADVSYIHYPKILTLKEKVRKGAFWRLYYRPYEDFARVLSWKSYASGRLILANSKFTAHAIENQYGIKPVVIYPPVNVKSAIESSTRLKKNVVLVISRFSFEKRLETVPRLAKSVDANFVILGAIQSIEAFNRIREEIRRCNVRNKVTLIPNAPLDIKLEILKKAKVYLHTMPFEHFGISIVEGMAAGCIPVVPDSGGPKEFVPPEWRYREDEDAIQKIQRALRQWSPPIAEEMRAIAQEFREERFHDQFSKALTSHLAKENSMS
jgi:alpha-1,2-mannosyltransferase